MKNFIFDIDGTLIDTMDMYMIPFRQVLANHGIQLTQAETKPFFGITAKDALLKVGVAPEATEAIEAEWGEAVYNQAVTVPTFAGIDEMLSKLHQVAGTNLIIVTSKTRDEFNSKFVPEFPIANYFDASITASDTALHKPNPEPILAGVNAGNGNLSESIYIGDTINDLKAAHAAGIKFGAAMWGAANPERLAEADYQLTKPTDLLNLI